MRTAVGFLVVLGSSACGLVGCDVSIGRSTRDGERVSRAERRIDEQLTPASAAPQRDGLAAAILIDVSGSMDDDVPGADGREEPKIDIARRAARDLVEQFARYAADHPDETVLLGLYEFSERSDQPDCRPVIGMAPPDRSRADAALKRMRAQGARPSATR